jgi:hypothetical protein
MKAFAIVDTGANPFEGNAEVIFAETVSEAIKQFCCNMYGGFDDEMADTIEARRTESLDSYFVKQNKIPKTEYVKLGWTVSCDGCGVDFDDCKIKGKEALCYECFEITVADGCLNKVEGE